MTHMCQKFAANLGKTELTYKPPIDTEDKVSDSKEEEETNDRPKHSFLLNIGSTPPSPVHKKQPNSSAGGKKKSTTTNKERNKRR